MSPDPEPGPREGTAARERVRKLGRIARGLAVDIGPLRRYRDFRLLWFGQLVSVTGRQITLVAVYIQVYDLTGSAAAVGLVGLFQLIPLAISSVAGGAVVDRLDRRKLVLVSQIGLGIGSAILMAGALHGHPSVWLVYGASGFGALFAGVDAPARSAMIPNMVTRSELPTALALNQVLYNTTSIVGPAAAGIVIGALGLSWAYGIDLATYGIGLATVWLLSPMPPKHEPGSEPTTGIAAVVEGFRYLRGRRVLQSTFTIDLVAMIFGMPRALFPILAATQFHRGPEVVGALFSAVAVGALIGALTAGWVARVHRQGRAVILAVVVWGAAITAFGLAGNHLWISLGLLAVAGAADVISAVFRNTILQLSVPDALRGRLSAIHILVVTGGPRLGDLEAGLVAEAFTPAVSVVSGGLACIAGVAVIAALVPRFWAYGRGEDT